MQNRPRQPPDEEGVDRVILPLIGPGTVSGLQLLLFAEPEPELTDTTSQIEQCFSLAVERYGAMGVDVDRALRRLSELAVSMHCWQGDDVGGFENLFNSSNSPNSSDSAGGLDGGLAVTGDYPGKARTPDELRGDLEKAMSLIPGTHRLNLHACYAETGGAKVDRNELAPEHFAGWIDWAVGRKMGMDFNPTYFSHPLADDGQTLSHPDNAVRQFWVEHGIACRRIGAAFGRALGSPCITNVWIPDGSKDTPADRKSPRVRLAESLDAIFAEPIDPKLNRDAVEAKLFGIGSESYVVGSHEFYLGYAVRNNKILCLDTGHFHPTEVVSDKISAVMPWLDEILLHVSRGVRWDSDHVVTLGDELLAIAQQLVRGDYLDRTHIGLDFFDASINRVAAWVIGTRNMLKALLAALLEPTETLRALEADGDLTGRLAMLEDLKTMPLGAVWNYHCIRSDTPPDGAWMPEIRQYEKNVLSRRG